MYRMLIPNYDSDKKDCKCRSYNDFLCEDFRMLICGPSNSGKANVLSHILRSPLCYYDKIIYHTANRHQKKVVDLENLFNDISNDVGYKVLEIKDGNEIIEPTKYQKDNRKIVIFDDLVNEGKNTQDLIAKYFLNGRHLKISPVYLSQSYYDIPNKIRQNASNLILFEPSTRNHRRLIARENGIQPEMFNKLGPYEFLYVDKFKKKVTKNFDELV